MNQPARDLTADYGLRDESLAETAADSPLKRIFDFALASAALLISLPLWGLFALAIKLEDRGPVFFPQRRWGKDKKPFVVYKFRTMVVDADKKFGPVQASENDPRITRFGRLLRATSLDEMPQIFNIWKGEMSWVGPRALPINEVQIKEEAHLRDEDVPGFEQRSRVRPGLTGVAQVYAPRDVPRRHKFKYDLIYISNQSFWMDLKLIALSFWITFRGKWESRGKKF